MKQVIHKQMCFHSLICFNISCWTVVLQKRSTPTILQVEHNYENYYGTENTDHSISSNKSLNRLLLKLHNNFFYKR